MSIGLKEQLISLQDAATMCPYSQDDLLLRARQGKLQTVQVDRVCFTTKDWVRSYVAREFFSLQEAARISSYSQEYLSLRARQGKLKAAKVGRNWSTTNEWLQEYIAKSEDYKKVIEAKKIAEALHKEQEEEKGKSALISTIVPDPPSNLPIYAPEAEAWEEPTFAEIAQRAAFWRKAQFAFATAMVVMLVFTGIVSGRNEIMRVANQVNPAVISFSHAVLADAQKFGFAVGNKIEAQHREFTKTSFAAGMGEAGSNYVGWVGENARRIAAWFASPYQRVAKNIQDTFHRNNQLVLQPQDFQVSATEKKGLVVVPSSKNNEKVKKQVKQSFSDEVYVYPEDEESGIITPVFRDRTGEEYLYILVPLQDAK
jgi:hypothetical protein